MNYDLIKEKLEELRDISIRGMEIIFDNEYNKDDKIQLKTNDMMKILGDITGEINRDIVEKFRNR